MADENYSSLREAVNRIIGAPAGGAPAAADQTVALAPKASYSQDLQTPTTTTATLSNTPYDPFAEQNAANAASLAATRAQNDQLAAQVAPAATTAPAATDSNTAYINNLLRAGMTNEAAVASNMIKAQGGTIGTTAVQANPYSMTLQDYTNKGLAGQVSSGALPNWGAAGKTIMVDPLTGRSMSPEGVSAGTWMMPKTVTARTGNVVDYTRPSSAARSAPVNPGPRAPWQASQQYWKDLAAYKGT